MMGDTWTNKAALRQIGINFSDSSQVFGHQLVGWSGEEEESIGITTLLGYVVKVC